MKLIFYFFSTRGWDELKMHCLTSTVQCGLRWVRRGVIEREMSGREEERVVRMQEFIICEWLSIYPMLVYSALENILSDRQQHKTVTITVQWLNGTPSVISLNWKHTLHAENETNDLWRWPKSQAYLPEALPFLHRLLYLDDKQIFIKWGYSHFLEGFNFWIILLWYDLYAITRTPKFQVLGTEKFES